MEERFTSKTTTQPDGCVVWTVLTQDDVSAIKAAPPGAGALLAEIYGVSKRYIRKIRNEGCR